MGMLTDEIKPALQGIIPAALATCALDGTPNVTTVSQVYWVDPDHVALSFQFFNKTIRNIRQNPRASVVFHDPQRGTAWELELRYERSETEGPLFESMEMQLDAIASMQGLSGVFQLKAADIYRVLGVRRDHVLLSAPPA